MSDDTSLVGRLALVSDTPADQLAAATRAVLLRVDRPAGHPQHLEPGEALTALVMLGLVDDPTPGGKRRHR